ncbi:MAG: pectate lyase [Bacteroidales bacterium]|nr:pectate lyase [Bacteroidales bacterium]MBN2699070.1 pectate lyase [Bacteroidales bacterium]
MATRLSDDEIEALRKIRNDTGPSAREITIDNGATYTQMHFLASVFESTGLERFKEGFLNGVDYLLEAQYENGGWPQYYPGREGYYENITFNDGAMIGVMNILRDIAVGKYPFVDSSRSQSAKLAIEKGVQAILDTQIEVEGSLTAWCAQYDPITLEPACARTYELKSISGSESVGILRYLMGIEHPDARIIRAVNEAIKWFDRVKLEDIRLIRTRNESLPRGFDLVVGFDPESKTPLWARFYEIGTNYPIFVGRDGVVKYALSEIEHERRVGYSWLGNYAGHMISEEYPAWCEKWNINNVIEESRTKNGEIRE